MSGIGSPALSNSAVGRTGTSVIIDKADSSNYYIGSCAAGSVTNTSSAVWRILRINISGSVKTIGYADGDLAFNNIWANRASLTYT